MQGVFGLKRILALTAFALATLFGALLAASPRAEATPLTSYSGRLYVTTVNDLSSKANIFTRKSGGGWKRIRFKGDINPQDIAADPKGKFVIVCAIPRGSTSSYVYRISTKGGKAVRLSGSRTCLNNSALSPDGRKVAYFSAGSGGYNLYVVPSSGGKSKVLARMPLCGQESNEVWVGKRIFFNGRSDCSGAIGGKIFSLRASDGKGLLEHTTAIPAGTRYVVQDVSPDGTRILALRQNDLDPSAGFDLAEISSADGTLLNTVVNGASSGLIYVAGRYSPDAKRAAVVRPWDDPTAFPLQVTLTGSLTSLIVPSVPLANPVSARLVGARQVDWARR